MIPFTDDDLNKLRAYSEIEGGNYVAHQRLKSLLNRLECAEKVCESSRIHGGPCSDPNALPNQCNLCAAYAAWLKSKGEAGR